jgi:hypothetical protein
MTDHPGVGGYGKFSLQVVMDFLHVFQVQVIQIRAIDDNRTRLTW